MRTQLQRSRGESLKFLASLFQKAGLAARWRQFRIRQRQAAEWRAELRLRSTLGEPGAGAIALDRQHIGPESHEYTRVSAAASVVSQRISADLAASGLRCHFCYGDSHGWGLVVGARDERQARELMGEDHRIALANCLLPIIVRTVQLADDFSLTIDIDSDERVKAAEGWFFRLRGDGPTGQSFSFNWRDGRAIPAVAMR